MRSKLSHMFSVLRRADQKSRLKRNKKNHQSAPAEMLESRALLTTLVAGDIAVIGYDTGGSPSDNFSILVLKDLDAGTQFFINDNEVSSPGGTGFADLNEGEASFTVKTGQSILAGTVINLPWGAAAVSATTYDWSTTSGAGLGAGNDELYVYTASSISATTPTAFIYFAQLGTSASAVPAGLTLGSTAVDTTGAASRYKTTGTAPAIQSGTKTTLLSATGNAVTNWEAITAGQPNSPSLTPGNWTFTVQAAPTVTSPTSASVTDTTVTLGGNVTNSGNLSITERGVIYSKTSDDSTPTFGEVNGATVFKVAEGGTTTGIFTTGITGLAASTGYSFVAYATNSQGTTTTSVGTFTTNAPVGANHSPSGTDKTVTFDEDATYTFSAADFGFNDDPVDTPSNVLASVKITSLPALGSLKLNGTSFLAGDFVPVASIPNLVFTPVANGNGAPYTTFTFQVQDDGGTAGGGADLDPTPNTITFNINAVQDAPTGTDKTVSATTTSGYSFNSADFGFADADSNTLAAVTITTIPVTGTLTNNGALVTAGQSIAIADISGGLLVFTPATGAAPASPYDSFTFQVQDNGAAPNIDPTANTITINLFAATTLGAGDIAVIGYNSNTAPDNFTIVVLKPLTQGTVFYVNDNEVTTLGGTTFADLAEGEASFTVKPGQTIAAGTVINLPWGATAVSTSTYDWSSTSGFGLNNGPAEELFIYSANSITSTAPTAFIYGIKFGGTTVRPNGLADGITYITTTAVQARYKTAGAVYSGTQSALLAEIGNVTNNWENVAPGNPSDWPFSVTTGNVAPTAVDDSLSNIAEDSGNRTISIASLIANDTDPENDTLTITAVSNPVGGTVSIVGSNVVFSPTPNFNGAASFDYTLSDGSLTDTGSVSFAITAVNDAPTAVDDSLSSIAEDSGNRTISIAGLIANDTDPENDSLMITAVNNAVGGTVSIVGSNVVFSPTPNFNGAASFDYTLSDGSLTDTGSVSFSITAVNDAPTAVDDSLSSIAEDSGNRTISIAGLIANDTDPENDSLMIAAVNNAVGGTVSIVGSNVVFSPTPNFNGAASFDYTLSDGSLTDTGSVSFSITAVNDAPTAVDDSLSSIAEDSGNRTISIASLIANDTDPENDTLTITAVNNAVGGTVSIVGSNVVFSPTPNFNGAASFDYTLSDGSLTDTGSVSFAITAVNDAPTAVDDSLSSIAEDSGNRTISIAGLIANDTDPENDSLMITAVNNAVGGTVSIVGSNVVFSPTLNFNGAASFDYTLSDGSLTDTGSVSFSITAVNDAPTITSGNAFNSAEANTNGLMGPTSSASPYLTSTNSNVQFTSILTVGDAVGGYKMVGIPDGLGAFDNGDGTFTLLMNHELTNSAGVTRAHGGKGAFVSKWIIRKSDLAVLSGSDLIQTVLDGGTNAPLTGTALNFNRFCSADLPAVSAFFNSATGLGTQERIFLNGEESGNGRAFAHVVTGPNAGKSYTIPLLSTINTSWENLLANPATGDKTLVAANNDTAGGKVYFYLGTKQSTGTEIQKAGLTNGTLYQLAVTGVTNESQINALGTSSPNYSGSFTLTTGTGTGFLRPEDGAWDPSNPNDYYFVTTDQLDNVQDGNGSQIGRARLYRARFTDINNPTAGGSIEALIDGTEGVTMFDNISVANGIVTLQEDVGNAAHNGKVWQYNIAGDALTQIAQHDRARFGDVGLAATSPFSQDEESSGVVDMSAILGPGTYLLDVQAHYNIGNTELVEGGQLLFMRTNVATGSQLVTTMTATDPDGATTLSYSITGGLDATKFSIDSATGKLSFVAAPNFESPTDNGTNNVYDVMIGVSDGTNTTTQAIQVTVTAVNETPSNSTAGSVSVAENTTAVTTATGTDPEGATLSYAISGGADAGKFTINSTSGVLTFLTAPNFEAPTDNGANNSYFVTVTVSDGVNPPVNKTIIVTVTNVDDIAPLITSGATGTAISENSGATQVIFNTTSTDADVVSGSTIYSLKPATGDFAAFTINGATGAVTLIANPNFETKSSYNFTVVATDAAGNFSEKAVTLAINNVDEVAPTITSGTVAPAINENSGAGQTIYTVTSTDTVDYVSGVTTYSLKPATGDVAAFTINGTTGAVTLIANPNFETKSSYSFTVVATDAAGNVSEKAVTLAITDVNEAVFGSNIFYNKVAANEQMFSPDQTGQRSMIRNVQIVFNGNVTIPTGAVTNSSFVVTKLGTSNTNVSVTVVSSSFDSLTGKTTVVLGFTSGTLASGSLADGNYRLVINYGVLGIDGDGDGQAGGTKTVNFHRLFGDSDGDRAVGGKDSTNYKLGLVGNASQKAQWLSVFDWDNDGSLLAGSLQDPQDKAAFFANLGTVLNPF